ncbi:MAG TPA: hypothetical protein VKN18_16550 [Blastocatellia bacterium]|nr:hypothetical protein [Blastocatellia bacterium]
MSVNREGGQGTQKSGQKPMENNQQDNRTPGQSGQQRDPQDQSRQQGQNKPSGGKQNR